MKLLICTQAVDRKDPILGFFHRWIEEFSKHCDEIVVLCLRVGDCDLPPHVTLVQLRTTRASRALDVMRESIARRRQFDAVFVHMNPEYIIVAGWLWRLMGKRVVLWYTHKAVSWRLRLALPFVHHVLTASAESFRIPTQKIIVMGHGIDTQRVIPARMPRGDSIRLMTSGRVSRIKGLDVLIRAYLELKSRGTRTKFSIFGAPVTEKDETYAHELREHLREAGENPDAVLVGAVPHAQMLQMRTSADYFLHASETGSLDKAVLDAILSGLIPLSSSDAYRELFASFERLLCYPNGDASALAERILALEYLPEEEREHIRRTLAERVKAGHSLSALVPRILKTLS